jgi:hypothetical protein
MWPFKKLPLPDPVTVEGVTAIFSRDTRQWELSVDGIDFTYDRLEFDQAVVGWAREAAPLIHRMTEQILAAGRAAVIHPGDRLRAETAEILSANLSEYASSGYIGVAVDGDDSWGDLGVTVTLKDGEIIAADVAD